jgi:hypothetical protein
VFSIETLQLLTSGTALVLGIAYVVGGLIVSFHLSQYGVSDYQILRVKYLVVGLVFLTSTLLLLLVSVLLTFALMLVINPIYWAVTWLLSIPIIILLLVLASVEMKAQRSRSMMVWAMPLYGVLSFGAWWFSLTAIMRQLIFRVTIGSIDSVFVILISFAAFIGQIYFYSRHLYGNPMTLDSVGIGIPVKAKLAGDEANILLLSHMGIPATQADLTDTLLVIDETDTDFIVRVDAGAKIQIFKVRKDLIKGIVYLK